MTIATNMAGRGTDIILGGNSDYMARLKVREYLMPQIVRPEEDENFMAQVALAGGGRKKGQGFGDNLEKKKKQKTWQASPEIFPTNFSAETEELLKEAVKFAVAEYGTQSLSELEADEKIAIAAEKAPVNDPVIEKLREAYRAIRAEYDEFTEKEHDEVKRQRRTSRDRHRTSRVPSHRQSIKRSRRKTRG